MQSSNCKLLLHTAEQWIWIFIISSIMNSGVSVSLHQAVGQFHWVRTAALVRVGATSCSCDPAWNSHVHTRLSRSTWRARTWPSRSPKKSTTLKACTSSSNSCFPSAKATTVCCWSFDPAASPQGRRVLKSFVFFFSAVHSFKSHNIVLAKANITSLNEQKAQTWLEVKFFNGSLQQECVCHTQFLDEVVEMMEYAIHSRVLSTRCPLRRHPSALTAAGWRGRSYRTTSDLLDSPLDVTLA